jgi:hypothetical protein
MTANNPIGQEPEYGLIFEWPKHDPVPNPVPESKWELLLPVPVWGFRWCGVEYDNQHGYLWLARAVNQPSTILVVSLQ